MNNKSEQISECVGDAYDPKMKDNLNILAHSLYVLSKGTRYKQDVIDIINACYPEYFKTE